MGWEDQSGHVSIIFINKTDPIYPKNEKTTGDIPLKQWHLKVWMQRIIDSCIFYFFLYIPLLTVMTACIRTSQSG